MDPDLRMPGGEGCWEERDWEVWNMRLERVQETLKEKGISYSYVEEDGCGSIDFQNRGLSYHIWEFADGDLPCGVETNLRHAGRTEELEGDYEEALLEQLAFFRGGAQ